MSFAWFPSGTAEVSFSLKKLVVFPPFIKYTKVVYLREMEYSSTIIIWALFGLWASDDTLPASLQPCNHSRRSDLHLLKPYEVASKCSCKRARRRNARPIVKKNTGSLCRKNDGRMIRRIERANISFLLSSSWDSECLWQSKTIHSPPPSPHGNGHGCKPPNFSKTKKRKQLEKKSRP